MVSLRKCTKSKTKQVGSIRAYQQNEALQEIQGFFNSLIWAHYFSTENQTQQDLDCEIWWPSNQLEPELITLEVSYFTTVVLFMDQILQQVNGNLGKCYIIRIRTINFLEFIVLHILTRAWRISAINST